MQPMVSPQNDVWEMMAEIPYWFPYWFQPIRSITQIWLVTRHRYGISAIVSQKSFCWETMSAGFAKCQLHVFLYWGAIKLHIILNPPTKEWTSLGEQAKTTSIILKEVKLRCFSNSTVPSPALRVSPPMHSNILSIFFFRELGSFC